MSHNDLIAQNCFLLISNPDSLDTIWFSWHNITSAKRAIINVFFLLFLEFCTSDIRRFRKANIVICDDMYSCTYHVSIGSDGFWILRVTIYSRIHKSYAPPYFFFPLLPADYSLFLYLRPGKLRWWWVFTHPLNYTLSAQLKNPGGPSADLQNSTEILGASSTSKKPSNRIERKIRFFVSLTRFHAFTHKSFVSFFQWLDTVFENHSKRLILWGFLLIFKHCVI